MPLPVLADDATLPEVATWMAELATALPPDDGFRHFNAIYLDVTERVVARVASGGALDPAFVSRLDVVFALTYQDGLVGDAAAIARAWRPMRAKRLDRSISPLRFAVAGMNAHINHDLVHALIRVSHEFDRPLDRDQASYRDYRAVDDILHDLMAASKDAVLDDLGERIDDALGPVDDVLEFWSIRAARQSAWTNAEIAQTLPGLVRSAHLASIDRTTGLLGRALLV
ncbi:MAG: hypothetical protein IPL61_24110 [Myxococcales bacterium]|nr:hypothetical protein [Myxococcales bacterium]